MSLKTPERSGLKLVSSGTWTERMACAVSLEIPIPPGGSRIVGRREELILGQELPAELGTKF
jgi:hypothetical protein